MSLNNIAHNLSCVSNNVGKIETIVTRIEKKLNETESIKHKLKLYLESIDSANLDYQDRKFLVVLLG